MEITEYLQGELDHARARVELLELRNAALEAALRDIQDIAESGCNPAFEAWFKLRISGKAVCDACGYAPFPVVVGK